MASYSAVLMVGVKPEKLFTRTEKTEIVIRYNETTGEPYPKQIQSYEFTFMGRKLTDMEVEELGVGKEDAGVPEECSFLPTGISFSWANYGMTPDFDVESQNFLIGRVFSDVQGVHDFDVSELQAEAEEIAKVLNVSLDEVTMRLALDRQ